MNTTTTVNQNHNKLKNNSNDNANLKDIHGPIWYCHCCTAKNNSMWICTCCQLKNNYIDKKCRACHIIKNEELELKCKVCGRLESYVLIGYPLPFHGENAALYRPSQILTGIFSLLTIACHNIKQLYHLIYLYIINNFTIYIYIKQLIYIKNFTIYIYILNN